MVLRSVDHAQEVRQERPTLGLDREVPLMPLHRRDDHGSRELQEALVKAAGADGRVLGEERHLVQKLSVLHQSASARAGDTQSLARDHVSSLLVIGNDVVVPQKLLVRVRASELVRTRRPDAEPPRDITRPDTRVGQVKNLVTEHRHHRR